MLRISVNKTRNSINIFNNVSLVQIRRRNIMVKAPTANFVAEVYTNGK